MAAGFDKVSGFWDLLTGVKPSSAPAPEDAEMEEEDVLHGSAFLSSTGKNLLKRKRRDSKGSETGNVCLPHSSKETSVPQINDAQRRSKRGRHNPTRNPAYGEAQAFQAKTKTLSQFVGRSTMGDSAMSKQRPPSGGPIPTNTLKSNARGTSGERRSRPTRFNREQRFREKKTLLSTSKSFNEKRAALQEDDGYGVLDLKGSYDWDSIVSDPASQTLRCDVNTSRPDESPALEDSDEIPEPVEVDHVKSLRQSMRVGKAAQVRSSSTRQAPIQSKTRGATEIEDVSSGDELATDPTGPPGPYGFMSHVPKGVRKRSSIAGESQTPDSSDSSFRLTYAWYNNRSFNSPDLVLVPAGRAKNLLRLWHKAEKLEPVIRVKKITQFFYHLKCTSMAMKIIEASNSAMFVIFTFPNEPESVKFLRFAIPLLDESTAQVKASSKERCWETIQNLQTRLQTSESSKLQSHFGVHWLTGLPDPSDATPQTSTEPRMQRVQRLRKGNDGQEDAGREFVANQRATPFSSEHFVRKSTRVRNSLRPYYDESDSEDHQPPKATFPRVERYSVKHGLGPPWKNALVFPSTGKNRATVNREDLEKLDEGEFLNDNLVNFHLRVLEIRLSEQHPDMAKRVYWFNTYFYATLLSGRNTKSAINYDAVKKWLRNVDLFAFDYIVVPIEESNHWYLAIICNVKALREVSLPLPADPSPQHDKGEVHDFEAVPAEKESTEAAVQSDADSKDTKRENMSSSPIPDTNALQKQASQEFLEEVAHTPGNGASSQLSGPASPISEDMATTPGRSGMTQRDEEETGTISPDFSHANEQLPGQDNSGLRYLLDGFDRSSHDEQPPAISTPADHHDKQSPFFNSDGDIDLIQELRLPEAQPREPQSTTEKGAEMLLNSCAGPSNASTSSKKSKKPKRSAPIKRYPSTVPSIITLDSLGATHGLAIRRLKDYIQAESENRFGIDIKDKVIQGVTAKGIPNQPNFSDCGLYLLGYMEKFIADPEQFVAKLLDKSFDKDKDWPELNASAMRVALRESILQKHKEQDEVQIAERKARKEAKVLESKASLLTCGEDPVTSKESVEDSSKTDEQPFEQDPEPEASQTQKAVKQQGSRSKQSPQTSPPPRPLTPSQAQSQCRHEVLIFSGEDEPNGPEEETTTEIAQQLNHPFLSTTPARHPETNVVIPPTAFPPPQREQPDNGLAIEIPETPQASQEEPLNVHNPPGHEPAQFFSPDPPRPDTRGKEKLTYSKLDKGFGRKKLTKKAKKEPPEVIELD